MWHILHCWHRLEPTRIYYEEHGKFPKEDSGWYSYDQECCKCGKKRVKWERTAYDY